MSARPGIVVTKQEQAPAGTSPRRYIAGLTVELRVFAPPHTDLARVLQLIDDAATDAVREAAAIWDRSPPPHPRCTCPYGPPGGRARTGKDPNCPIHAVDAPEEAERG